MITYIYGLYCPVANEIRYVGKSDDPVNRFYSHVSAAKGRYYEHHTCRWLRKILSAGHMPRLVYLQEVAEGDCWKEAERFWVSKAIQLGWKITNSTEGGDGVVFLDAGDRARFCAAVKAGVNTPERKAMSSALMNKLHSTPEFKAKIAKALADPEMIKRRGQSIKVARNTPESKEKTSAQARAMHADPEMRKRLSAKISEAKSLPEARAKTSAQMKERHANATPEQKLEMSAKHSSRVKDLWADPVYRAKQTEAFKLRGARKRLEKAEALANSPQPL